MITPAQASLFRQLTIGDARTLGVLLAHPDEFDAALAPRVACVLRIAALIAMDADTPAYQREVNAALHAGASVVGTAMLMSAAPRVALTLGYDVDQGLAALDGGQGLI